MRCDKCVIYFVNIVLLGNYNKIRIYNIVLWLRTTAFNVLVITLANCVVTCTCAFHIMCTSPSAPSQDILYLSLGFVLMRVRGNSS